MPTLPQLVLPPCCLATSLFVARSEDGLVDSGTMSDISLHASLNAGACRAVERRVLDSRVGEEDGCEQRRLERDGASVDYNVALNSLNHFLTLETTVEFEAGSEKFTDPTGIDLNKCNERKRKMCLHHGTLETHSRRLEIRDANLLRSQTGLTGLPTANRDTSGNIMNIGGIVDMADQQHATRDTILIYSIG